MEAIERISSSNDLLTLTVLLVLLLLVLAKNLFPHRFDEFISLFSSGKYMIIKSREHKALFGFNVIMLIVHILIISLFIFTALRTFTPATIENTAVVFLRIITAYGFFILLKFTVEKIIANVFDIDNIADHFLFQKHTYRNFISLLLFPIAIFLIYSQDPREIIFYVVLGIFIAAGAYLLLQVVKKNEGVISRNWFYFILYLCALEITPYVILFKLITTS